MALRRQIATFLAVAGAALALGACGEDSPQGPKIPKDVSDALIAKLDTVQENIDSGDCTGDTGSAPSALASLREGFEAQAGQFSQEIADQGRELLDRLEQQVTDFCDAQTADEDSSSSSSTTSTEPTTTTTTTTTTDEDKSTTTSTKDEPTTPEPDQTTPEPTTPEPPAPPGNGPDGNGPPGQDGGFQSDDDGGFAPGRSAAAPRGGRG
jgi:hypothetical protein